MQYRCYGNQIPYVQLLSDYKLISLEARRKQLEALFLYSLCHNKYDCPSLINQICYCIPTRTHCRNPSRLFATNRCRTNAGKRQPLYRMVNSYNNHFNSIDIAATRPSSFKKAINSLLK